MIYLIEVRRKDKTIVGGKYSAYANKATAEHDAAIMLESFQRYEYTSAWTVQVVEVEVNKW